MATLSEITNAVDRIGLVGRGALRLENTESVGRLQGMCVVVLIGMVGSHGWRAFQDGPEARDGLAHPLDRWSRRVIDGLASEMGALALYPFEGPPHWPFQRWAMRAQSVHVSPLGLLIHPQYGLWHSYRGALAFAEPFPLAAVDVQSSPCDQCYARPCLHACPVGAFTPSNFDVAACVAHLHSVAGHVCMDGGCLARRACPVGARYAYGAEQSLFYMAAFRKARSRGRKHMI
jgi:ferredoxin